MIEEHGVFKNFRNLNVHQRTFVAKKLIEINELQIPTSSLTEKLVKNELLTIFFEETEFVCLGLKESTDKMLEAILSEKSTYASKELSSRQINAFLKNVKSGAVCERGWALNHSKRRGALALLESGFDDILKSKGINRSQTFCTVVSTNSKGNASALRSGYKLIGKFPSPFSGNILKLYIGIL